MTLTLDEVKALLNFLSNQYVSYEDMTLINLIRRLRQELEDGE